MLIAGILMLLLGVVMLVIGWVIWKKQKIELIHNYHYAHVREESKAPYCAMMGQATMLMGLGCGLTGLINWAFDTLWGWALFSVCAVIGIGLYIHAENRFNNGNSAP